MSQSTDGLLVYGYNLGSSDDGWKVREASGEYGELVTPWYNEERQQGLDFLEAATEALLAASGFTEQDTLARGYYDRRLGALERMGVEIETYCSDVAPMYVLCADSETASRGAIIDMTEKLSADRTAWDERLTWALKALSLSPVQEKPAWLLCSYADGF